MKTLEEIIKQEPVFLNDFESRFDVVAGFEDIYLTEDEYNAESAPYVNKKCLEEKKSDYDKAAIKHKDHNIIFASYGHANYSGEAFVLVVKDNILYEVNANHCSCYGIENQWQLEETDLLSLKHRLLAGNLGTSDYCENEFRSKLMEFLGVENA